MASASVRTRPAAGSTRSSSPGARRPVRTISPGESGTAPASDATATIRSAVSDQAAGRSPLRSSSAPTRRPSLNTNAPGPSHGATNPATRRRNAATAGCGRAAEGRGLGDEREQGALERPAGRDQQLQGLVERPRVADARGEEGTGVAEPVGGLAAAARDARVVATAAHGLAVPADGVDLAVVRDERERLGERPDGRRVGRVPLVEHRERDVDRRAEVREQLGEAPAGHQALVDDGPRRGGHDGERRPRPANGRWRRPGGGHRPARARSRSRRGRPDGGPAPAR